MRDACLGLAGPAECGVMESHAEACCAIGCVERLRRYARGGCCFAFGFLLFSCTILLLSCCLILFNRAPINCMTCTACEDPSSKGNKKTAQLSSCAIWFLEVAYLADFILLCGFINCSV